MPALDGVRILDMTQYEAGTSCTQALAWLGADVVKIEAPEYGDPGRGVGRSANKDYSAYFCAWNANKRSLALDLRTERGHELFVRLVPKFDVFVENYGPGVTEKLDIGYETLRAANPGLIYTRIKGFGATGPYSGFRSMDMVAQAAAGAFSITGEADGPPMMPGPTTGDSGTGVQAAMAILAAYIQRQRDGRGPGNRTVDAGGHGLLRQDARFSRFRLGNPGDPPLGQRRWPAARQHLRLQAVRTERLHLPHARQPGSLGRPVRRHGPGRPVDRSTLRDHPRANRERCGALRGNRQLDRRAHQVRGPMETIAAAGVPCSACLDTAELHHDRHLTERGFVHELDLPVHGRVPMLGFAPRMSESPFEMTPPPRLGEHTDEVLAAELGLDEGELAELRNAGAIGDPARFT